MGQQDISTLEKQKSFSFTIDNESVEILITDVDIIADDIPGWSVANKDNLTVALDITLSPELEEEGIARELVNKIQRLRKDSGLDLTDRIIVYIEDYKSVGDAIIKHNDYICAEILADRIEIETGIDNGTEIEVNDVKLNILISKSS